MGALFSLGWESAVFEDDWRRAEAYAGLDDLSPADLAWEFLRRNPDYRADYAAFRQDGYLSGGPDLGDRRFARWGLSFPADPAQPATLEPVFWSPGVYAQTIVLAAAPRGAAQAIPYRPATWPGAFVEHAGHDGRHAVLRAADGPHRLWIPQPIRDGAPVACVVPLGADAAQGAAAIVRFWRAVSGAGAAGAPLPDSRLRRLRLSLKALDGHDQGASYRALAETLFGAQRVAAEAWRTSSLRDATIRLVRTGQLLAGGQYRRLLGCRIEE